MTDQIDDKTKVELIRRTAMAQATHEVIHEHKVEIIKRARAKLVAMGIELEPEDQDVATVP